ncbi:carboxypeptidase-like regulatory domain-containing protein [Leminorella grimontii]|uniref:carboxypeptidase-like regulatory domain-containing protein n=1 Tax=Leminorella grimontii TaxID=82981 RepID=UPI002088E090|nr:carboxypeptidase-like regulatory domain-containing protein [Leminorella grimontii]GKX58945.1 hypothetical protein SOASR031_12600 [Leminorella grimontii]
MKIKKKGFFYLLAVFGILIFAGRLFTNVAAPIEGKVVDSVTERPISGVVISRHTSTESNSCSASATTNKEGEFRFSAVYDLSLLFPFISPCSDAENNTLLVSARDYERALYSTDPDAYMSYKFFTKSQQVTIDAPSLPDKIRITLRPTGK